MSVDKYTRGTYLNIFVKQQYRCKKCKHIGRYDYSYIQIFGKSFDKPWKYKKRPTHCEKCNRELDFGYGAGHDAWIDDWSGVWAAWLFCILGFFRINNLIF